MDIAIKRNYDIGVIIGRFQAHLLHEGHAELIDHVTSRHKKVIIFLGVSSVLGSKRNPLDFVTRKLMIESFLPEDVNVTILPLVDKRNDDVWSLNLDLKIKEIHPIGSIVLYGARDSFIPHYTGAFDTQELEPSSFKSGTDMRNIAANSVLRSPDFRAGCIYSNSNTYPTAYPVIDAIILDEKNRILLGRKQDETQYRLIGGFVDPTDDSYEQALKREVREETGLEVAEVKYLTSHKLDDWRYRNEPDRKMITAVYTCKYLFGTPVPQDDIVELKWFILVDAFTADIVPGHKKFLNDNINKLKTLSASYL